MTDGWSSKPVWPIQKIVEAASKMLASPNTVGAEAMYNLIPKQIQLTLKTKTGPVTVAATQIGDLAVHPHLEFWGQWQVTHVPTGVSFMKATPITIVIEDWTELRLIEWCKLVQQHCRDEWNLLATLTNDNYNDVDAVMKAAKDRVQAMCRNTSV